LDVGRTDHIRQMRHSGSLTGRVPMGSHGTSEGGSAKGQFSHQIRDSHQSRQLRLVVRKDFEQKFNRTINPVRPRKRLRTISRKRLRDLRPVFQRLTQGTLQNL